MSDAPSGTPRAPMESRPVSKPLTPGPGELAATAVHDPVLAAWSRVEESIAQGLVATLVHGLERHRAIAEEIELHGAPPADWSERTERLLRYRRVVSSELLEPLLDVFEHAGPASHTASALADALAEATRRAAELPTVIDAPWQEGALAAVDTDTRTRRLGKAAARLVSSARRAGRTRPLPLRFVAARHLHAVVGPGIDEGFLPALGAWSEWITELERIWIEWSDEALPALIRAEVPRPALVDGPWRAAGEEASEEEDPWTLVRSAATTLTAALDEVVHAAPHTSLAEQGRAGAHRAGAMLEADLAVAGSFVLRGRDAPSALPRLRRSERALRSAHDAERAMVGRLKLYQGFLSLLAGATAVQQRLVLRVHERCLGDIDRLLDVAAKLDALHAQTDSDLERDDLLARIAQLETEARHALHPALEAIPASDAIVETLSAAADTGVETLVAIVRQAPGSITLRTDEARPRSARRRIELRPLAFQDLAGQAFDALRIERVRGSAQGVVLSIEEARADIEELDRVASFAFEAARRELAEGVDDDEPLDDASDTPEGRALALIREALRSMAESLRATRRSLFGHVRASQIQLATELATGSSRLFDHLSAGRVQARLLAARSRITRFRAWLNERWGPPVDHAYRHLARRVVWLRGLVAHLLRRGTAIVAGAPVHEEASARSMRELGNRTALSDRLPLVYQRLFSPEPLSDASLLAGREAQLTAARARWGRWRQEDGVPLIVQGRPGSGITSFIRVLIDSVKDIGGTSRYLSLDGRVRDEAELAVWLAGQLELPRVVTIDELARAIFAAPQGSLPDACALDNLEHLYLRVPNGTDLVERLLTLMAETEPRIFWIGGVTSSAWQIISASEPTAVSQIDVLELAPLGPAALRAAITTRHRRSGLPVSYVEPATGRKLLRHRLKRMRDPAAYQALLETDFFDQLTRTSAGHLGLALYQWLAAADFERSDGVWMDPPTRPDFSILESLSLAQNFTLKAFLEHRTLTIDEHDRIFRLPHHESYQIFESLGNRHLIEALPSKGVDLFSRSEVEERLRYRVRPVLVGAVTAHLRGRNIVH